MILEDLVLTNFCLFRGRQVFHLAPAERNGSRRPLVLFGGVNGAGKTTLLDALQLALYGPRARCSKRTQLGYDDFLRQSIHHGVAEAEGASVALSFRCATEGADHCYEVRRAWRVQDGRLREELRVTQDGLPDSWLAENWPQLVEDLIPLEIAQLFFFDAEKIRTLAEDESSSQALGDAIKSLLGLDLVERLIADAAVLQTRLAKEGGAPEQREALAALENQVRELEAELALLQSERSALENYLQRADNELKEAEQAFAAVGGKHWEARQERARRQGELENQVAELRDQLLALAAGELPLALVPDLLAQVAEQDAREHAANEAETVQRLLSERDGRLLDLLKEAEAPPRLVRRVRDHLEADRQARHPAEDVDRRLGLSVAARAHLRHLREVQLPELVGEARRLLDKLARVDQELLTVARAQAATPDEAAVSQVAGRLKAATEKLTLHRDDARRLDGAVSVRKSELDTCRARLARLCEGQVEREIEHDRRQRLLQLAGRTRTTMQEFLQQATRRKIHRLSALITESFRFLVRKTTLVERILIDPDTFAITLYDAKGYALAKQRLSEGEKQIFAIAVLWGLARAAARPLPAVIDTPMARLDAAHRRHLVERYFPHASHQVVILSTDTEVDRQYYAALQPALARAYHLTYDDVSKATVGEEGYFWKGTP